MNKNTIDKSSVKRAVIEFELSVVKELYKNNKISSKEYEYVVDKLNHRLEKLEVNSNLFPVILDIKI